MGRRGPAGRGRACRRWVECSTGRLRNSHYGARPPRGFDPDLPCVEDLKLKDFLGVVDLSRSLLTSAKLLDHAAKTFAAGSSLMTFLCKALNLPY